MSYENDLVLMSAMIKSDTLSLKGLVYDAYTNMHKAIMKNFTRMGVVKTILYLFDIVDQCNMSTQIFVKDAFITTVYRDAKRMIYLGSNKSQLHFWAGCAKICEFRNEAHLPMLKKMENLMIARQHFRSTIQSKTKHILAPYLLTVTDNAYFDLCGRVPVPDVPQRKPEDFYNHASSRHQEIFIPLAFVLGKLTFYLQQYYLAERFLNMVLNRKLCTPLEDYLSHYSLTILFEITKLKKSQDCY